MESHNYYCQALLNFVGMSVFENNLKITETQNPSADELGVSRREQADHAGTKLKKNKYPEGSDSILTTFRLNDAFLTTFPLPEFETTVCALYQVPSSSQPLLFDHLEREC